jgi:hypothetical protein
MRTDGGAEGWVTVADEAGEPALEGRSFEQQVAAAGLAAEPDVSAEAVDEPRVAAARMSTAEAQDVAQVQLDGSAGHRSRG